MEKLDEISGNLNTFLHKVRKSRSQTPLKYTKNREQFHVEHVKTLVNDYQKIDMFAAIQDLSINIPDTLIKEPGCYKYLYTQNNQIKKTSGEDSISSFFKSCEKVPSPMYKYPKYVIKHEKGVEFIYYDRIALQRLECFEQCIVQQFVYPKGNRMNKIRVQWKSNGLAKLYSITSKLLVPRTHEYLNSIKKRPHKRTHSLMEYIKRYKETAVSKDFSAGKWMNNNIPKVEQSSIFEEKQFLLNDHMSDLWDAKPLRSIPDTPDQMITGVLNALSVFYKIDIKEMVIDFLRDHNKKWFVLQVKQILTSNRKKTINLVPITPLNKKIKQKPPNKKVENMISSLFTKSNTFKMRMVKDLTKWYQTKSQNIFEKDVLKYMNTLYNKPSEAKFLPRSSWLNFKTKKQSFHLSQHTNQHIQNLKLQNIKDHLISKFSGLMANAKEITIDTENLCSIYGGQRFVNKLVAELYGRLISDNEMREVWKDIDHEKMERLKKIFTHMLTMKFDSDFRKEFKEFHLRCKSKFHAYTKVLYSVLTDFNVEHIHRDLITKEVKYIFHNIIH